MIIPPGFGVCPGCNGSGRLSVAETSNMDVVAGYDRDTNTIACTNCGGQTMYGTALGYTEIDPATGAGCLHKYAKREAGRCYVVFTCAKCRSRYDVDSSD